MWAMYALSPEAVSVAMSNNCALTLERAALSADPTAHAVAVCVFVCVPQINPEIHK